MSEVVKGFKAFNKNMQCRGMQYEVGKEYTMEESPIPCQRGFHFCKSVSDCYEYYEMSEDTRICEIEAFGEVATDDEVKFCTNGIRIVAEIENPREASNSGSSNSGYRNSGDRNSGYRNSGYRNSGDRNSGDRNSGYRNSGDWNSGDWNSGDRNSGDWNSGYRNSGYRNSGDRNSGDRNSGYRNSGDWNSGDWNSGDWNSGYRNSGDWNSGDWNSGDWNSGDRNSGVFCTDKNPKIKLFDKDSDLTYEDWWNSRARRIMEECPYNYSDFICSEDMTDEEKENHPEFKTIGGFIKTFVVTNTDKQAWWNKLSEDEKQTIFNLPNFDAEKFKSCTGITVKDPENG